MKYLGKVLSTYKKEVVLAPLFKMLEATFDLLVPLVVADMIDRGIPAGDRGMLVGRTLLLVGMAAVGLLFSFTAQYFAARAAIGSATKLRRMLFDHVQRLSPAQGDVIGASTLITRMTGDINQVQGGVNLFLRLLLRSPFVVLGALIAAFTISVRAALYFVGAIVLLLVIVFGIMRLTQGRYRAVQARLDGVTGAVREDLSGVRVVRAFAMEDSEVERFDRANGALTREQLTVGRISALMNPLTLVVVNLCVILILHRGGYEVNAGVLGTGAVIALVNYMSQILVELVKLANLIVTLSRSTASLRRVEEVLDTEPDMVFPEGAAPAKDPVEAVAFDRVSLTYPRAGAPSLADITFTARRGETVGVIGPTGSGKTSLVSLIARAYDATEGTVRLLGAPVASRPVQDLRAAVAVVPQKAQLFTGTVRSNLLWGCPDAPDDALWAALEAAQAADFVREKPLGLDEPVAQGGRNFSGGQRQRLTIARALVRRPDVLILDDSSSALDYATDAALRRALRAMAGQMTVFIVSQRTASLRHADRILVLDEGHLAGQGTHDELMASCPLYREIHESQYQKGDERA